MRPQPAPLPQRTKFDRWLWERDITNAVAAKQLGCVGETVRRYRLPFDDADRRIPDQLMLGKIHTLTGGAIKPADFYPPELTAGAPEASDEVGVR